MLVLQRDAFVLLKDTGYRGRETYIPVLLVGLLGEQVGPCGKQDAKLNQVGL